MIHSKTLVTKMTLILITTMLVLPATPAHARRGAGGLKAFIGFMAKELAGIGLEHVLNPGPDAAIKSVRVEHNQWQGLNMGMRIHVELTIGNRRGSVCNLAAYFTDANGLVLKDFNGFYATSDSQVSVQQSLVPAFDETYYSDVVLFLPYDELHMRPGNYDLQFHLEVQDPYNGLLLASSKGHGFHFSKSY